MDARLTRLYQDELVHLHEMGQEFAQEHPKIAARLGMQGIEVADPYVERLLEGFAFLTARVRLKLDAEYPRLIEHLLDSLYPHFLAPTPSMLIARLDVDATDPNLADGYRVPRGSALQCTALRGQKTACEYRTTQDMVLWPLQLESVRYFSHAADLGLSSLPATRAARGGLRLRLRAGEGLSIREIAASSLTLYISAPDDVCWRLHELLATATLGTLVGAPVEAAATARQARWSGAHSVRMVGFADEEAILPESLRAFSGHRLMQEVAALPQRLAFFEIGDLAARLAGVDGPTLEIVVLFERGDAGLEALVDGTSLALHCTPAINLFPRRLDRVVLSSGQADHHVVPDRTRPMDYEVHSIVGVQGHGSEAQPLRFEPLYAWRHDTEPGQGWYTLRRDARTPSEQQRQHGARVPSYLGQEVFLSLLDPQHGAYRESLRQLSVQALVTNRDLPVLLPQADAGGGKTWRLETPGPVSGVRCLKGPTRPQTRDTQGAAGWRLVAQLTRHHIDLLEGDDQGQANVAALRELLLLLGPPRDTTWQQQLAAWRSLRAQRLVRRLPFGGPLSFGSGLALTLEVDEQALQGASAVLLASAIEALLARHAAINSFIQLNLISAQRGVLMRWPPRLGTGALL